MPNLSDLIEEFIKQIIKESDNGAEIQRNELALKFNCVPSQINYVISTRFTNEMGYYVESKRGGGGHIKIRKINVFARPNYIMHAVLSIGESISQKSAEAFINNFCDYEIINDREAKAMKAAISDKSIDIVPVEIKDILRANILRNMIMGMAM